jgi:hypothetical protein
MRNVAFILRSALCSGVVTDENEQFRNPYADNDEATDETSLAGRFFLWRWYKRTTRGFGVSRPWFMPLGFLSLAALAFYHGYPALVELTDSLLWLAHRALQPLADLLGGRDQAGAILDLRARRGAVPVCSLGWAVLASAALVFISLPLKRSEELGYVVPGSGLLARCWAVIGRRLYQLKRALRFLLAYVRDLNLQKIHLPVSLLLLVLLAYGGLVLALENLLFELPARFDGLDADSAWIAPAARIAAAVIALVLGLPMLVNGVLRAHQRSVALRTGKRVGFIRRRLRGLLGVVFVFAPLAWMALHLLGGA